MLKKAIFCGTFTNGVKIATGDGKLTILQEGRQHKFINKVTDPVLVNLKTLECSVLYNIVPNCNVSSLKLIVVGEATKDLYS